MAYASMKPCAVVLVTCVCACASRDDTALWRRLERLEPPTLKTALESWFSRVNLVYNQSHALQRAAVAQKLQPRVSEEIPFPCDVSQGRSADRPTSVDALRPGDIDVIAAMGDSVMAALGSLTPSVVYMSPNRGVSFAGGGQGSWRQFLTLPNILREFNPGLIGYSDGDAMSWQRRAHLNVAEWLAVGHDLLHQAKLVEKRMLADKRINYQQHWKLVTIMIGPNDFCDHMCFTDPGELLARHGTDMADTLDYMLHNIPRLLVNIVPAPVLQMLWSLTERPLFCDLLNAIECPCLFGLNHVRERKAFTRTMIHFQRLQVAVAESSRYRGYNNFSVVVQPFSVKISLPRSKSGGDDLSYLAPDCFHLSQKAHALAANALWNNMLEPVGMKTPQWEAPSFGRFLCPTPSRPYIRTLGNSLCSRTQTTTVS